MVAKRKETKKCESTKRGESVRDTPRTGTRILLEKKQKVKIKEKKSSCGKLQSGAHELRRNEELTD